VLLKQRLQSNTGHSLGLDYTVIISSKTVSIFSELARQVQRLPSTVELIVGFWAKIREADSPKTSNERSRIAWLCYV